MDTDLNWTGSGTSYFPAAQASPRPMRTGGKASTPASQITLGAATFVDQESNNDYQERLMAQRFVLPPIVKSRLDSDIKQANAFAVSTALFAGALMTLAQLVDPSNSSAAAWNALRFFTYSSVIINLSGTAISLVIIKKCTDVPQYAQWLILTHPHSLPARVARGEPVPRELMARSRQYELLTKFGMSKHYRILDMGALAWIICGVLHTFSALMIWIWLTEEVAVAAATTAMVFPAIVGLLCALFFMEHTPPIE